MAESVAHPMKMLLLRNLLAGSVQSGAVRLRQSFPEQPCKPMSVALEPQSSCLWNEELADLTGLFWL